MFAEQKKMNNEWMPKASIKNLKFRAKIISQIRNFFKKKKITEVETPILSCAASVDPHLLNLKTKSCLGDLYLQTSPEFAMKRLIAYGLGPIYQICKSFRDGEFGRYHNIEFTMLEWYRPGFTYHDLMDEVSELLQFILKIKKVKKITYQKIFEKYVGFDPHQISMPKLHNELKKIIPNKMDLDREAILQLLMQMRIEPKLKKEDIVFIYDYPKSQAMLARVRKGKTDIAERFEVYVNGIELANGFQELNNPKEQLQRFMNEQQSREKLGLETVVIDHHLIEALEHGFPKCSGVALGIDRLIMLALQKNHINEVISFDSKNA